MLERPPKELAKEHVELCLDADWSFYGLALFSVDMYFRANVTLDKLFTEAKTLQIRHPKQKKSELNEEV